MVSEHGSPLRLDGWFVGHAFMLVAYVLFMFVVHVLVAFCMVLTMVAVILTCEG